MPLLPTPAGPVRDLYFLLRESEVWGILHYFAYCGSRGYKHSLCLKSISYHFIPFTPFKKVFQINIFAVC